MIDTTTREKLRTIVVKHRSKKDTNRLTEKVSLLKKSKYKREQKELQRK